MKSVEFCDYHTMDMDITNKEGLAGNVKLKASLGCSDHDTEEINILRAARRAHSKLAILDFRRANLPSSGIFLDHVIFHGTME